MIGPILLAAVVVEVGGSMGSAALAGRELGLPAIAGRGATTLVRRARRSRPGRRSW